MVVCDCLIRNTFGSLIKVASKEIKRCWQFSRIHLITIEAAAILHHRITLNLLRAASKMVAARSLDWTCNRAFLRDTFQFEVELTGESKEAWV